jgi:two-component system, cell cycle sensor histidine kinase and response regulator CckA
MSSRKVTSSSRGLSSLSDRKPSTNGMSPADYRMLIETFPQWVWMATPDGRTTFCNQYWYEFSGLTVEQTFRNEWPSILHPDDKEFARNIFDNAIATGQAYESEFRYRRARDGQYRWHRSKGIPIKDASGQIVKWIGFGIDIHDSKTSENELADREARLRAILETGPECIKLLSAEGVLLEMNPAGLAMIEADSAKQVIGKAIIDTIVDKPYQRAFHDLSRQVFQGQEGVLDYEITGLKGTHRWLQTHATPLKDKDGAIRALLAITRDITQRKRAEDKLRASEARFRALVEHSSDAVALLDAAGKIQFCSSPAERILHYRPEELVGHAALEFVHPDDRLVMRQTFDQALRRPREAVTVRARVQRKDGSWRVLEKTITNLLHDPNVQAMVDNFRDITENVQAEEALRTSEERFAKAFRSSPLPIIITTRPEGRYLDVNAAALELSGYSREEVVGRTVDELNLWVEPGAQMSFIQKLKDSGRVTALQTTLRHRSGEIRQVELFADLIELGGSPCVLCIARDVTEARKMEAQFRQAQKMEAVGRLAGGVAHDFNNMLAVIVGYCQILQDRFDEADPAQKHIQQIRKASHRAAGLTRQLLAFSRKQVLQPRVLNLNAVVNNLSRMLLRMIGEDISLVLVPGTPLGSITADLSQIEQVLMNLVVNSRDAMPQGGKIIIETANVDLKEDHAQHRPTVVPGAYVMLSVRDSGCGMDEQTRSQVFEPFFTTKGPGKGTGLGLSMVYGVVKQSNGYIWVESEVEKGTTFKIYFPRTDAPAGALIMETPEPAVAKGSETVLLVEDEPSLRELVVDLLTEAGYTVLDAGNVEEALKLAQKTQTIHLLLTDVIMPTMSGSDLAARLRTLRPGLKVLYMSGYSADLIASHGVLEAETQLLEKPFTTHALLAKVRNVLGN